MQIFDILLALGAQVSMRDLPRHFTASQISGNLPLKLEFPLGNCVPLQLG